LLKRVQKDLEDYGSVEQQPLMEGRQMVMVIAPRKHWPRRRPETSVRAPIVP